MWTAVCLSAMLLRAAPAAAQESPTYSVIVLRNDPAPGTGGGLFGGFDKVLLSDGGRALVVGSSLGGLNGFDTGAWGGTAGSPGALYIEGGVAPGTLGA